MQIHQLMDACLFALAFWLAYRLRSNLDIIDLFGLRGWDAPFDVYVGLYLILIPAAPLLLEGQGFYARPPFCPRSTTAWMLFKGCCFTTLGLVLAMYLFKIPPVARWIVIWFSFISFGLVFAKEEIVRWLAGTKMAQAQYRRRVILVGTPDETIRMETALKARSEKEVEILARLDLSAAPVERLVEMLHEYSVNSVILSAKHAYFERIEAAIRACELEGVEAWLVADFFKAKISRTSLDDYYGLPILVFRSAPESSWPRMMKHLMDLVGSFVLLISLSWLLVLIAVLIKWTSPGPVLFRQRRSGVNGRPFTLYKFRTMVSNAEQLKHELAAMNEMTGPVFKVTNDPRVTPIGWFLRKFSLDELPQLLNVLRGEMSLVGPRPLPVDEVKQFYDLAHRRRLSVKPGLTCLWQIGGRNKISDFQEWVRLDLEYIDNWSLWLDLKILFRTLPVVLSGEGAK
ncbi:MAG TPA: sugar transferase [Candidatus Paceibacterota bacterium]|nr:sugar transferase [Verrucomicrobiota bacterium]HSA11109.1 sugar transferase [Candidatus Paceibacterota bacterium]